MRCETYREFLATASAFGATTATAYAMLGLATELWMIFAARAFAGLMAGPGEPGVARGEYMARNIVAADPDTGVLAIADCVEEGQSLLFAQREAGSAREDLKRLLDALHDRGGLVGLQTQPVPGAVEEKLAKAALLDRDRHVAASGACGQAPVSQVQIRRNSTSRPRRWSADGSAWRETG